MDKKKKNVLGFFIIGSAIIWGVTILACALILKETFSQISLILYVAASTHLILIWGPLVAQFKKQNNENNPENRLH